MYLATLVSHHNFISSHRYVTALISHRHDISSKWHLTTSLSHHIDYYSSSHIAISPYWYNHLHIAIASYYYDHHHIDISPLPGLRWRRSWWGRSRTQTAHRHRKQTKCWAELVKQIKIQRVFIGCCVLVDLAVGNSGHLAVKKELTAWWKVKTSHPVPAVGS